MDHMSGLQQKLYAGVHLAVGGEHTARNTGKGQTGSAGTQHDVVRLPAAAKHFVKTNKKKLHYDNRHVGFIDNS